MRSRTAELTRLLAWNRERFGLAPAVGLDDADDNVDPVAPPGLCRQEHLVCLADTGRGAEKNLQPPATLLFCRGEQCFR